MIEIRQTGKAMPKDAIHKDRERKDRTRKALIALAAALVLLGVALALASHFRTPAETVRHVLPPLRDRTRDSD